MENKDVSQTEHSETTERDPLFEEVARQFVAKECIASASAISRVHCIGFNRASRIIEQLEAAGILGRNPKSKPFKVLVDTPTLETMLNSKNMAKKDNTNKEPPRELESQA